MTSNRSKTILVGAVALAAFAGLGWLAFDRRSPAREDAAQPQVASEPTATARGEAHAVPQDDGHGSEDGHAHDHGDEAPNVDLRARYFDAPQLIDARTFAEANTPLLVEASCRANPAMAKDGSAEQRLRALYAMNPQERFPQDMFYRSMIQFWRYQGQYFQLSAIWEIGLPPMYQLRLHRSPTSRFEGAVVSEALPEGDPGTLDAAATADAMAAISQRYVDKGATLGLQIVETEWPAADGKGRVRAVVANGRPVSWSFPGGNCVYEDSASAMRCRCPSGSERIAPPKTS
jgi:hypothetical protein